MDKEKLIVGVHGNKDLVGGHYNVLSSFSKGLLKGLQNNGIKAFTTEECFEQNLVPNITIGFNVMGYPTWPEYMNHGITNIMWSVDSVFYQNLEAIEQFNTNKNFVLFNVSPSDNESLLEFYPSLNHTYIPHGTDLELWKKQDCPKEHDIVFLSSIADLDAKVEQIKQTAPKNSFDIFMILYDTWTKAPNLSFWQLYQVFRKEGGLELNLDQYHFFFRNLTYLVTFTKRVQMIQNLQNFNVKIFGDGPWEKYIKGNVKYMGKCDLLESIDIINKSKIVLHNQPTQLSQGLHERLLNACAVESFVLTNKNLSIEAAFEDSVDYFDINFENAAQKVQYYFENEDERVAKAKKASQIVAKDHSWDSRAKQILNMIN